jgi:hypothetical protein
MPSRSPRTVLFHVARMFPAKAGIQPRGCGVRLVGPERASILQLRQSTDTHDHDSPRAVWPPTLNRGLDHVHQRSWVTRRLRHDQIVVYRDDVMALPELALETELERLTAALTAGGELSTIIQAIREREGHRDILRRRVANLDAAARASQFDPETVERALHAKLADWRGLLRKHVPQARQILRKLLGKNRLQFKPYRNGRDRGYEFTAQLSIGALLAGIACATMVASPTGFEPVFWP